MTRMAKNLQRTPKGAQSSKEMLDDLTTASAKQMIMFSISQVKEDMGIPHIFCLNERCKLKVLLKHAIYKQAAGKREVILVRLFNLKQAI